MNVLKKEEQVSNENVSNKSSVRFNKSVYFVMPMVGITASHPGLINCYLGDNINKPELNFKRIFIKSVYEEDEVLYQNENCLHFYNLLDGTVMYEFKIPERFEKDYEHFCEGRYSMYSEECKQHICKLSGIKPVMNSRIYKIFYKTADQKKKIEELIGEKLLDHEEVCSKPDLESELY